MKRGGRGKQGRSTAAEILLEKKKVGGETRWLEQLVLCGDSGREEREEWTGE